MTVQHLRLQQPTPAGVRCLTCIRRCEIGAGETGRCQAVRNDSGALVSLNYDRVSSESADPIEKKPIFHYRPGSLVYTFGGWSCNLFCGYCRNDSVACVPNAMSERGYPVAPREAVGRAIAAGCDGIGWSYSEPSVWFDFTLDCAIEAARLGLFSVYVTNGTLTAEALCEIGPYLDCWRVDLKGFSNASYATLGSLRNWAEILERTIDAKWKWGMHVEVVTCLVPTLNDSDAELRELAHWIASELGPDVPWHVQRFYPLRLMGDYPMTTTAALRRARDLGREAGLRFVYVGNALVEGGADTRCPACTELVVERRGRRRPRVDLTGDGCCRACGAAVPLLLTTQREYADAHV